MPTMMTGPGCRVEMLGRAGLRYHEGARTVRVDGEMLAGPIDFVIYEKSIRWESSETPIDEATRKKIVENIRATFEQNGRKVDVE